MAGNERNIRPMKKHTLVLATHNDHKAQEIMPLLPDWVEVKSLNDIGYEKEIPETGSNLEQNALQKAYHVFSKLGFDCFADDTGLEVEALMGAPGVYSARYAGAGATFDDNIDLLLKNLANEENRKAKFRTVICLIFNGKKWIFEGAVNGTITKERRGAGGFGYDPVFLPEGYQKTFAEMNLEEKNNISHRARALEKMISFLNDETGGLSLAGQGEFA
jgi:XTP/dITP diphosphohydrolase